MDSCDCSEVIVSASVQNSWVDFAEERASGISPIPFSFPYVSGYAMPKSSDNICNCSTSMFAIAVHKFARNFSQ